MKTKLTILLTVLLLALTSCRNEDQAILQRIDTVYKDVAAGLMSSDELRRQYCSKDWNKTEGKVREFEDKYNQGMVGFFDYDYWIQAQDCDNIHISDLAVESRKGNRATVSFLLHNFSHATPMRLELLREKGGWKIDNFISQGDYPRDLKAEMKEYLNE